MPDTSKTEIHPKPTEVERLRDDVRKANSRLAAMADLLVELMTEAETQGISLPKALAVKLAPYNKR